MRKLIFVLGISICFYRCSSNSDKENIPKDDSEYVILNNDTIKTKDIVGIYCLGVNEKKKSFLDEIIFCQIEFRKDGICEIGGVYPLIGINVKTYYKIQNNQILIKNPKKNEWMEPTEIDKFMKDLNGEGTVKLTR